MQSPNKHRRAAFNARQRRARAFDLIWDTAALVAIVAVIVAMLWIAGTTQPELINQ